MSKTMEIQMTLEKSTKGTRVYTSDISDAPVTTLYVKRKSLPHTPPEQITIKLNYE